MPANQHGHSAIGSPNACRSVFRVVTLLVLFGATTFSPGVLAQDTPNPFDAPDPFDSPLAPLPPVLLGPQGEAVAEPRHEIPGVAPTQTINPHALPGTFDTELRRLQDLIDQVRSLDPRLADSIEQKLQQSIERQTAFAETSVANLASSRFSSRYPFSTPRFDVVQRKIEFLRNLHEDMAGARKATDDLASRLTAFKRAAEDPSVSLPLSSVGERSKGVDVHHVAVRQGSALPSRQSAGDADRLTASFAEVHVRCTQRPIILLLSAKESIVWRITKSAESRIFAVVLDADSAQKVVGLDGTMVLRAQDFANLPATMFDDATQGQDADSVDSLYAAAMTRYSALVYDGTPIELGPQNEAWRNAYLVSCVESLLDDCELLQKRIQARRFAGLRYEGFFSSSYGTEQFESSRGEFNLRGPIADTLTPLGHADLKSSVTVARNKQGKANEDREFGITHDHRFVTLKRNAAEAELVPIPLPNEIPAYAEFHDISLDRKRNRLLMAAKLAGATAGLVAFEVETGKWETLARFDRQRLLGVSYMAADDTVWAVALDEGATGQAELLQIDAEGETRSRRRITNAGESLQLNQTLVSQLTNSQGLAVLMATTASLIAPGERLDSGPEVFVIDPTTGELLYQNTLEVNSGTREVADEQQGLNSEQELLAPSHLLLELASLLDETQTSITRNLAENSEEADSLLARLASAKAVLYGKGKSTRRQRVHVVARYSSSKPVRINVTDTGGPVTLVLCGNHRIQWDVQAANDVVVERIILAGQLPQTLVAKPGDARVESYFGKDGFAVHDPRDRVQLNRVEQRIQEITNGTAVDSFLVAHQATGIERVGPDNVRWSLQVVRKELREVLRLAEPRANSSALDDLTDLRFWAVHHGDLPRCGDSKREQSNQPFVSKNKVYWNLFSLRGPLIGENEQVHRSTRFGISDAANRWLCQGTIAALTLSNREAKASESLDLRFNNKALGQLAGIGFDEKRNRLLIHASRGLFTYTMGGKNMTRLRSFEGLSRSAFAYSSDREQGFAIHASQTGRREVQLIERFNAMGVRLPPLRLSKPVRLGSPYTYGFANLQLVSVGDYLILLRYEFQRNHRLLGGRQIQTTPTGHISVIRLGKSLAESGEVIHEGTLQPSLVYQDLSQAQLESQWERLGSRQPDDLDSNLWSLAMGGDSTLQFLRTKFKHDAHLLSDVEVQELVRRLDDDRFSKRNEAYRTLRSASSRIGPVLAALTAEHTSNEVRSRVRRILANWQTGVPQTAEERRLVRALEVLSRIGLPSSKQYLASLAGQQYPKLIRQHATLIRDPDADSVLGDFGNPVMQLQQNLFAPE